MSTCTSGCSRSATGSGRRRETPGVPPPPPRPPRRAPNRHWSVIGGHWTLVTARRSLPAQRVRAFRPGEDVKLERAAERDSGGLGGGRGDVVQAGQDRGAREGPARRGAGRGDDRGGLPVR